MQGVFFTTAVASRKANGEYVIVLQVMPVRIIECREAGAMALREALDAVLRK